MTTDVFNQQGSSCTMQADVGVLRTGLYIVKFKNHWPDWDTEAERHTGYLYAQGFDPWPGGEPAYEGSSTDAPFKLLRSLGQIDGWRWLFGEEQLREWVTWYGPAAVGTDWTEGMFYPDEKGYLTPTGANAGGHAWRVIQYSIPRKAYRMVNSWSREWGYMGRAWVAQEAMAELIDKRGGECAIPWYDSLAVAA
jgi:hypothetical protein